MSLSTIRVSSLLRVAALSGCGSTPDDLIFRDQPFDPRAYKTFAFNKPVAASAVQQAIREQMQRLGYVYDEHSPDLRVHIKLRVEEHTEVRWARTGNLTYRAWGPDSAGIVTYQDGIPGRAGHRPR